MGAGKKRSAVAAVLGGAMVGLTLVACVAAFKMAGGAFTQQPAAAKEGMSPAAKALIEAAFEGLPGRRYDDLHVHLLTLGTSAEEGFVNPVMQDPANPIAYAKYQLYLSASGIDDEAQADAQYFERLDDQAAHINGAPRLYLLAFDQRYRPDGSVDIEHSEFHTPNAYAFELARRDPARYEAVMSVHPYRADALEALERWAGQGGRLVKWLPNAMGIDPADPALDPYYDKMRALGLTLLTHAGEEQAVEAEADQALGNPLRLRRALDRGVKVIVAHCASLGEDEDLDDPARPRVSSFDLWLRLMEEPRYEGLVFGEISGTTQFNRLGRPLRELLSRAELHHRLVYASDYPLPGINALIRTWDLEQEGYLDSDERAALNEIYDYNPLLYDFVLKRTMHHPESGARFPAQVFAPREAVFGRGIVPAPATAAVAASPAEGGLEAAEGQPLNAEAREGEAPAPALAQDGAEAPPAPKAPLPPEVQAPRVPRGRPVVPPEERGIVPPPIHPEGR